MCKAYMIIMPTSVINNMQIGRKAVYSCVHLVACDSRSALLTAIADYEIITFYCFPQAIDELFFDEYMKQTIVLA